MLIPRPETEELVEWVLENIPERGAFRILDIGTGSGCMAITVALKRPSAAVWAIDLSSEALAVAKQNARKHEVTLDFRALDILDEQQRNALPMFDVIMSNPPYITDGEESRMDSSVYTYEPKEALFVTNDDPFQFYKAIADFAKTHLLEGGQVFFEINAYLGAELCAYFQQQGWAGVTLRQDMQGKDRMIRLQKTKS